MNDFNKFIATKTGKGLLVIVLLAIGFFSGMEYKTYQIKKSIASISNSINDSRIKGDDAMVKADISNLRAQIEIYSAANGDSYNGACSNPDVLALLNSAENAGGGSYVCNVSSDGKSYAVATPLKSNPETSFCVDSTGQAITINQPLGSATVCR